MTIVDTVLEIPHQARPQTAFISSSANLDPSNVTIISSRTGSISK